MTGLSGPETRAVGRRSFLVGAGRGLLGVAVLGLAGCRADDPTGDASSRSGSAAGLAWSRVDLAYVSAYVLVHGGEAAVVDAGLSDSADRIGEVLDATGPGWDGLRYVVVTHAHWDHFGSLVQIARRAPEAVVYAGKHDILSITEDLAPLTGWPRAQRLLRPAGDGDEVFGLQVVDTPGHTLGHIAVFDPDSGVLVAGDALTNTVDEVLAGAHPDATEDKAAAADSVRKLAALRPQVILVGHGPPVERDAAAKLRRLASSQS